MWTILGFLVVLAAPFCNGLQDGASKSQNLLRKCCDHDSVLMKDSENQIICSDFKTTSLDPLETLVEFLQEVDRSLVKVEFTKSKTSCSAGEKLQTLGNSEETFEFLIDSDKSRFSLYSVTDNTYYEDFCVDYMLDSKKNFIAIAARMCDITFEKKCENKTCLPIC